MVQTAFRNLVDTQYRDEATGNLVAKAFLTYEEVIRQIEMNFCQEERDIMIAYLTAIQLPTRRVQEKLSLLQTKNKAGCTTKLANIERIEVEILIKQAKLNLGKKRDEPFKSLE